MATDNKEAVAGMTDKQMEQFAEVLAAAMRGAAKDPIKEHQKEAARLRLRAQQKEDAVIRKMREDSCIHMREDNTSVIAWMQNSDGIVRGVCQRCNTCFDPSHANYVNLRRIPYRSSSVVYQ
jgi:hypothetical protein